MKKALLFGASGFVGSHLLEELLNNPDYKQVTIVVRKDLKINHPKLKTLIGDFNSLPGLKDQINADDIFIALGTTKANTPDPKEYYQVDHDYPVLAAKIAKEKGAKTVSIVSAVGANDASSVAYIKMKGETERDIIALNFDHTNIFRPSMIMGNRKEKRRLEKFLIGVFSVINPLMPSKFKGIDGKNIARAMNSAARNLKEKVTILQWKEMTAQLKN